MMSRSQEVGGIHPKNMADHGLLQSMLKSQDALKTAVKPSKSPEEARADMIKNAKEMPLAEQLNKAYNGLIYMMQRNDSSGLMQAAEALVFGRLFLIEKHLVDNYEAFVERCVADIKDDAEAGDGGE